MSERHAAGQGILFFNAVLAPHCQLGGGEHSRTRSLLFWPFAAHIWPCPEALVKGHTCGQGVCLSATLAADFTRPGSS